MAQAWSRWGLCALLMCAGIGSLVALRSSGAAPASGDAAAELEPDTDMPHAAAANGCERAGSRVDTRILTRLLARLESARSPSVRCLVLHQLATHAAAGDAAVRVLEQYTQKVYPMRVRACAVHALGDALSPAAVGSLLQLAAACDAALRETLVQALAARGEPAARAGLIALARDDSSALRMPAVVALAELDAPEAVQLIEDALQTPGLDPRRLIRALGEASDPQALVALKRLLDRGDNRYTSEICGALGELGKPEATQLLLSLGERPGMDASFIYQALASSADPGAQRALLAAADSGKAEALGALGALETPEVSAWMLRALDGHDSARLRAAMAYVGGHADERAVPALARLVRDGRLEQGHAALATLGNIGGAAAAVALEELAASEGPLQASALTLLAQQPEAAERARSLALMLLEHGDAPSSALGVLASDGSPEARAALLTAARGSSAQSQRAIWMLARRDDPEVVSALSEMARAPDAPNRLSALSALAEGGSPQAAEVLRDALRADDPVVREEAVRRFVGLQTPDAEQAMLSASRDAAPEVRSAALSQLGELATPPALDRLAQLASGSDDGLAQEALQSLAGAAPERASAVVDSLLEHSGTSGLRAALGVVSSLPEDATQHVLERALGSADSDFVRDALTHLQDTETVLEPYNTSLARVVHDSHLSAEVREQARNMLLGPAVDGIP